METNPIKRASEILGSSAALARELGVSKGAVWQWENERQVPAERCPDIELATHGEVTCEELRPDVKWSVVAERCKESANV